MRLEGAGRGPRRERGAHTSSRRERTGLGARARALLHAACSEWRCMMNVLSYFEVS